MESIRPWYSFAGNGTYPQAEIDQNFFELDEEIWMKNLLLNSSVMYEELKLLKERKDPSIVPYFNRTLANKPENWTIFPFMMWGYWFRKNSEKCPQTYSLLRSTPHLVSATFSILLPGAEIPPHVGDSNVMYRCHIPLKLPSGSGESFLKVGDEIRKWEMNHSLCFCDAQVHQAVNKMNEERWILIIDVIRPEFRSRKNWISGQIFSSLLIQFIFQRIKVIQKLPRFIRRLIMIFGGVFTTPFLVLRRKILPVRSNGI